MSKYSIGIDFGTLSGRAVIVDIATGEEIVTSVREYAHGVMADKFINGQTLPADFALQHPGDYLEVLYFIAQMRCPFLDFLFETITHLGEETLFLVISILFFWCINKREGYFILLSGLFGTLINQAAKITFRVDRPWVKDPSFLPVGNSQLEATGYSFPSGHTQNVATTWGCIAAYNRKKWLSITCIAIILLVSFSRLYLGVHTLLDVSVSLGVALLLVLCLRPLFATEERFNRAYPIIVIVSVVLSMADLIYVLCIDQAGVDGEN